MCQIRIQDEEPGFNDVINEQDLPLVIGLAQVQIPAPEELVINNQGSFMLVSNKDQIQIMTSAVDNDKIQINSLCILDKMNLPVIIQQENLEHIIFNFFEINTFFACG